jgi:hypothetical protein
MLRRQQVVRLATLGLEVTGRALKPLNIKYLNQLSYCSHVYIHCNSEPNKSH